MKNSFCIFLVGMLVKELESSYEVFKIWIIALVIGKSVDVWNQSVREKEDSSQKQADAGSGLRLADSLLKWAMQPYLG